MKKIINLLNDGQKELNNQNIPFFILSHILEIPLSELYNFQNNIVEEENVEKYFKLIKECKSTPYQYVINKANFLELELYVDNRVFIPRFETEEVVNFTIDKIYDVFQGKIVIADICTGSGAIALAMKNEFIDSKVIATELSKDAIDVAKLNSDKLNLPVEFFMCNTLDYLIENNILVDVLISNPPYIGKNEYVEEIVIANEPEMALFSEEDGLVLYKEIIDKSLTVVNDEFILSFEIGYTQSEILKSYIENNLKCDFKIEVNKDINGKDRNILVHGKKWKS